MAVVVVVALAETGAEAGVAVATVPPNASYRADRATLHHLLASSVTNFGAVVVAVSTGDDADDAVAVVVSVHRFPLVVAQLAGGYVL